MRIIRHLEKHLDIWAGGQNRRPLLLRGARQVGKSVLLRSWGAKTFQKVVELNLEQRKDLHPIFNQDLVARRMLSDLEFVTGANFRDGTTLLFLDEIQACPNAIMALRYFYEEASSVPIVAAGSLIEFILEEISFPVGRIDSYYLFPVTFFEYLDAIGKNHYTARLQEHVWDAPLPEAVHQDLLFELKRYFRVGGLPEALASYISKQDLGEVSAVHRRLISSYRDDFPKYSRKSDWELLDRVFNRIPHLVGNSRVKYSRIDPDSRSYKVKKALLLLERAGLLHKVLGTGAVKLPLQGSEKPDKFKLLSVDIGLFQHLLGFDWRTLAVDADLLTIHNGAMAEQFVGQELIAAGSVGARYQPHFWFRHAQGADAEVDYVVELNSAAVPLEVKSGVRGKLKSLTLYEREFKPKQSIVLSQRNIERIDKMVMLPLYMAGVICGAKKREAGISVR